MNQRAYGWKPQLPDHRDFIKIIPHNPKLPALVDLRPLCPPIYDQGQAGSCTGNGCGAAMQFDFMKQGLPAFTPARLFIYYNERVIEGTVNYDAGAAIRDGLKTLATQGVCNETEWPYVISKVTKKPSAKCYRDALKNKATVYETVAQDLIPLKTVLAGGELIVFGFTVYESFESAAVAKTGKVPMPAAHERVLGGHCVCLVGYDDAKAMFICRNSWGTSWGLKGYFYMPYNYVTSARLASDFWTIKTVS